MMIIDESVNKSVSDIQSHVPGDISDLTSVYDPQTAANNKALQKLQDLLTNTHFSKLNKCLKSLNNLEK